MKRLITYLLLLFLISGCATNTDSKKKIGKPPVVQEKINGVSYEMPLNPVSQSVIGDVKRINAQWVAHIPYGHTNKGGAMVYFSTDEGGWWGENVAGVEECIKMSRAEGLKTMLKPHVWVVGQGWPGKFDLDSEAEWQAWEKSYEKYILAYAKVAEDSKVDLFCVGTEYRIAIVKRPLFWSELIDKVRKIYHGPLTYASNWDNFRLVTFWSKLDYIGVDAYFPLSDKARPTLNELKKAWEPIAKELKEVSAKNKKPVLFTEYGYKSTEFSAAGSWNYDDKTVPTSMSNQTIAYQALFETFWKKDWMAGGFLWKWHLYSDDVIGREKNRRYTPQGKDVEKTISKWYK